MALILPPNSWAYCTTSLSGTPTVPPGTVLTAGTANVDGTTVALITAITHDVQMLVISVGSNSVSGTNTSTLCDIFIDPAGGTTWSAAALINDLLCGYSTTFGNGGQSRTYYFPIFIKSGASIGARIRCATAASTSRIIVKAYGGAARPDEIWVGQNVQEIGITAASSLGQSHTPGNTGAFSAWTNLGSTLTQACGALQFAIQGGAQTVMTGVSYHWEFGVGSTRIGPTIAACNNTNEGMSCDITGPIFCNLPAGTQLQVRGTCSGTAQAIDVAAYAVS